MCDDLFRIGPVPFLTAFFFAFLNSRGWICKSVFLHLNMDGELINVGLSLKPLLYNLKFNSL